MRDAILREAVERAELARSDCDEANAQLDDLRSSEQEARDGEELALSQARRPETLADETQRARPPTSCCCACAWPPASPFPRIPSPSALAGAAAREAAGQSTEGAERRPAASLPWPSRALRAMRPTSATGSSAPSATTLRRSDIVYPLPSRLDPLLCPDSTFSCNLSLFLLTYVLLLVGFAQAAFVVGTKGKKGTAALVKMNRKLATNAKAEREPPSQGGAGGLVLPPL